MEKKIVAGIAIIVVVALVLPYLSNDNPSEKLDPGSNRAFAKHLVEEYDKNEVAANMKYKNKVYAITGTIVDIGTDLFNEPYLILEKEFGGVQCYFPEDRDREVAGMVKGWTVTVVGKIKGKRAGTIQVKNCYLKELL